MKRTILPLIVCFLLLATLSACGGDGKAKAAERYRLSMRTWATEMMGSAMQVSGMFSDEQTASALLGGDAARERKLNANLRKLSSCSKGVKALWTAPPEYRRARAKALRACTHFETGADLIKLGLTAAQGGLGVDLLEEAASDLQNGIIAVPVGDLKLQQDVDQHS